MKLYRKRECGTNLNDFCPDILLLFCVEDIIVSPCVLAIFYFFRIYTYYIGHSKGQHSNFLSTLFFDDQAHQSGEA